jgi:hypothetical protein
MIHLVIANPDIRRSSIGTGERWHVLHPGNDAILAYCNTEEEAKLVCKGLNDLAAELAKASK